MRNEIITSKHRLFIAASFCAFFVMALPLTVQGSIAPLTMAYYGISAAQQGLIITMQSAGAFCTAIFIALRGERYNKIHIIALGIIIICIMGAVIAGVPFYALLLGLIVIVGIGTSFIDVMMNSVFSDVYPKQKNVVIPIVHAFYSVGATVVPIFVTLLVDTNVPSTFSYLYRLLFILAIPVFVLYFISGRRIMADTPYTNLEAMKKRVADNPAEIFKTKTAWFYLAVGMMYFTFQIGNTIWLPTYAIRETGADFSIGAMMVTAFFGGTLVMRFLVPLFLRKLAPYQVFSCFGWVSVVLMLAALFADNSALMLALVAISGFFQGSNVATFILMCTEAFPERTASASALCSIAVGIAFLSAPLWMGALSDSTGFLFPMILICGVFFVSATLVFFHGKKSGKRPERG
jgi:fucose permease